MKKNVVFVIALSILPLLAFSEVIEKEFTVSPGKKLDIDLKCGGRLDIQGWEKNIVSVKARLDGRDAVDCKVEFSETSSGVQIFAHYEGRKRNYSSDLKFEIMVPTKFDLSMESMGGAISIDNVNGAIEGKTMGGALNLQKLQGTLDLTTMGGGITLKNSDVDGRVKTMGGQVLVEDVRGDIKATTQGGKVTQRNVTRRSGESGKGEISIKTMGGDINVDDAPEGTDVHTMGGRIHIKSAAKFARAKTMGGDIEIEAIDGGVNATTMGGDVTVTMVGNANEGDRNVELTSMGGDVVLSVPPDLSMQIDIELAYTRNSSRDYKITSDFPIKQEETSEWDREGGTPRKYIYGTGNVSGGKNRVRIKTVNGNVTLKRG